MRRTTSNDHKEACGRDKWLSRDNLKAMFTLYWIVKLSARSVAESVSDRASVHTRNATFWTIFTLEQKHFASLVKDIIPAMQRNTCSCSHCTESVSARLCFTIRESVNLAQVVVFFLSPIKANCPQKTFRSFMTAVRKAVLSEKRWYIRFKGPYHPQVDCKV